MMDRPDYLIKRPDGSVVDTRLGFGRDARVRITQGPHAGPPGHRRVASWTMDQGQLAAERSRVRRDSGWRRRRERTMGLDCPGVE